MNHTCFIDVGMSLFSTLSFLEDLASYNKYQDLNSFHRKLLLTFS